jgi:hypothetical protein
MTIVPLRLTEALKATATAQAGIGLNQGHRPPRHGKALNGVPPRIIDICLRKGHQCMH